MAGKSGEHGDVGLGEVRRQGGKLIERITDYLEEIERLPVVPRTEPGEVRARLPQTAPMKGERLERITEDVEALITPGLTHWNHPGFMAYFGITGSVPGMLGEFWSAAFNVNAMLWKTSPAATELEEVVLDWLRQMLGLAPSFFGVMQDTASVSTLCALAAAREWATGWEVRRRGLSQGAPLALYTSEQAHSSVEKAAIVLGVGQDYVRKIPVDDRFRLKPDALARAIGEDRAAGAIPFAAVATVGTTSTTSVDPVPRIAEICAEQGLWLHVDAAYAGAAAILPERSDVLDGCDRADSLVVNPHKWLFTQIDCSALYCRRPESLRSALAVVPEYLRTGAENEAPNFMDYGIALGRRFRALKLWFVLRAFGVEGIRSRIREHIRLAQKLRGWIAADPDFELMAPVPFSTVCFRARPESWTGTDAELDPLNERLLQAVNDTGEVYLSHTKLNGRYTLRVAIGNIRTGERHVRRAWELLHGELDRLSSLHG